MNNTYAVVAFEVFTLKMSESTCRQEITGKRIGGLRPGFRFLEKFKADAISSLVMKDKSESFL